MLLSLLMQAAHAYTVACAPYVSATLPAPDATFVPLNIRPLVILDGTACATEWGFVAELMDSTGAVLAAAEVSHEDEPAHHIALPVDGELLPDQSYILRISPTLGFGNGAQIAFTTGSGYAEPLGNLAPALTLRSALREKGEADWTMTATGVSQGEVNYGADHALFVLDPADRVVGVALPDAAGLASFSASWTAPEAEKELCLRGMEEDGAGFPGPISSEQCMESERGRCATSPSAGSATMAAIGLLALARRRR